MNPFKQCSTPISETELQWFTEARPYCIQVPKGEDGAPTGIVEIFRREGRRPKAVLVDVLSGEAEMSDGTTVSMILGQANDDAGMQGSVELRRGEGVNSVIVRLSPWPEGVTVALPA